MSGAVRERKAPAAPLEYLRHWPIRTWLVLVTVYLYAPLLTLVVFSFNNSKRIVVWRGFTFDWYLKALQDSDLITAFGNSLTIAAISTLASLVLGAMTALLLWRFRFPVKTAFEGALALPIVVPEICMGVAMLVFFTQVMPWPTSLPWPLNLGAIIISHISFSFSFVAIVIRARLASFNRELEEAAKDLGAGEWRIFRDIIAPHMTPGLVAGGLLAFTLSLDDFVITFFTSGPETTTFPIKVYSMVRFSVTPEVNAASTILIVITVLLTFIALRLQGTDVARNAAGGA
jgi:spermidine/putrescine transport system permease protein